MACEMIVGTTGHWGKDGLDPRGVPEGVADTVKLSAAALKVQKAWPEGLGPLLLNMGGPFHPRYGQAGCSPSVHFTGIELRGLQVRPTPAASD